MIQFSLPPLFPSYAPYPFPMAHGKGDQVFDDQGQAYWDFYGGHCVCSTGHSHPKVVQAIAAQAEKLLFYSTAADIPLRNKAAEGLLSFANQGLPQPLASVFFCNSGAEANENALKVAVKLTGRHRFVSFSGGWHGRSALALSVTDDPKLRVGLESLLAPVEFLPLNDEAVLAQVDFSEVAGVILEPIQSMAGIRCASRSFLHRLRKTCDLKGSLLIFDEVQTGMGRLGKPFAANFHGVTPDLITTAKGIGSGFPLAALLMSEVVASNLRMGDLGSTFGGGPLACAALLATLEVIQTEGLMDRAAFAGGSLQSSLSGDIIRGVAGEGLLLGLCAPGQAARLKQHLFQNRILVGGSGDPEVLRLMPPLNISDVAIEMLLTAVGTFQVESRDLAPAVP